MGFETCGANEALVVYGCCLDEPNVIVGGRVYAWPFQMVQRLGLNVMTIVVDSKQVFSLKGVRVSVQGIAQVNINGKDMSSMQKACQQFLGKDEHEIVAIIRETLEGNQRAMIGIMTIETIFKDKNAFSREVLTNAKRDLYNMGIQIVSYTLKDVHDEDDYLVSIGKTEVAQVQCKARIGQCVAKMESAIKTAEATEVTEKAKFENLINVAAAEKELKLRAAANLKQVKTKQAISSLAATLQKAITTQKIKEEKMQVDVIERGQQIQIQEQEIIRKERELDAKVRKPAEAEKYKIEKLAEGNRNKIILEAEAEAESIRIRGEAEAFAITAKARAEAEQMQMKADAWGDYQEAALVDMLLDTLPKVAAEIAAPLSKIDKVTMISSGSEEIGASKITKELLDIVINMPNAMERLTGVDITRSFRK